MNSDVVRWLTIDDNNKNKNVRDRCSSQLHDRSDSVIKSIVLKLVFLFLVINFNVELVLADKDVYGPDEEYGHFTPHWAVHIPDGTDEIAQRVAHDHGFIYLGKIIDDYYHFHHNSVSKRSISPSHRHQDRLDEDHRVRWAKQQRAKSRRKRDFLRLRQPQSLLSNYMPWNDPKWSHMWYLNRGNGLDMNVIPAWKEGITGKGVVVTILDDGLESDHPDLQQNYDPKASYDVNGADPDPMPHYDMTDSNRHGTRCAGEVAATANNSLCAVGIAYEARVGGVRMLDGDVTDLVEAKSLGLNPQHIDIYSASWGPDDDGKTVDGPGEMATLAFSEGVKKGRNGKGSIFIWASGNGGREHDNCNCDGYTNSIWTLSISSATEGGEVPWYSEKCSSTLATTYSSGGQGEKQVVTTDLHHTCTTSHTGTSASAPLAAGIAALVLEANRNLTWRDLQHIVVRTAKPGNLKDSSWSKNGIGRRVSHSFGYGLMDAAAMVRLARTWKTVPEQNKCEINAPHLDKTIPPKGYITLQLTVQHCKGVNYLEHVQAKITLTSQRRGDIQIYLKSPAGTKVCLLTSRSHDVSRSGFNQWPFMSVHTWGEAPHGNWQLEIHNEGRYIVNAMLKGWSLIFYGTATAIDKNDPVSVQIVPLQQHSMNNYPVMVLSKPNGGKNNRKQHQQKGVSTPPFVLVSPRKNQKNSKNNSGKNWKRTTTVKPLQVNQTTTPYYYIDRSRKYETFWSKLPATTPKPLLTINNNVYQKVDKFVYDKIPIKAPKQVKENAFTTSDNNFDKSEKNPLPTSNPNIPKLFQKYEKVQEIYPEFHPYDGPKYPTRGPFALSINGNGKPSRENSKSFFFGDTQQYAGSSAQKKSSLALTSQQLRTSNSRIPVQSNVKGQITQWDLIFHGTDDPVQPNDPPRKPKSGLELSYGGEIGHNSLEFDSDPASGMWRDMQQIGESHVDVQRTASKDETGTACRNFAPNKQCIECLQNTFLYEGRCYTACPQRSFMVPEQPKSPLSYPTLSLSLRSIDKLERAIISELVPQKRCETCHFSCLNCRGPNDYDCTECTPDSVLTPNKSLNETYCSSINQQLPVHNSNEVGSSTYVFLLILGPATVLLIFVVIVSLVMKSKLCGNSNKQNYVYDRIDFDAQNDEVEIRIEDIPINVSDGSEDESD